MTQVKSIRYLAAQTMNEYLFLIAASLLVVVSYLFSELFKRTNIPSVILLISGGIIANYFMQFYGAGDFDFMPYLQILGVIGLIMIVLEGALDLEVSHEKLPLIIKSLTIALGGLILSVAIIAVMLKYFLFMVWSKSILYAIPMSVISSAIVIPSVENLNNRFKEFLIYESCLSDILGIVFFYYYSYVLGSGDFWGPTAIYSAGFVLTLAASLAISIALIILFRFIQVKAKFFLFLAILVLVYSLGKLLHLSSLVLILVFGVVLKNNKLIFKGFMANWASPIELRLMERNFHFITAETSFLLRTFFFFIFGLTISLQSLLDVKVLVVSVFIVSFVFLLRWLLFRFVANELLRPAFFIGPRGLITIMLFYSIPNELVSSRFENGILLWVILLSGAIMAWGLIGNKFYKWDKSPVDENTHTGVIQEAELTAPEEV